MELIGGSDEEGDLLHHFVLLLGATAFAVDYFALIESSLGREDNLHAALRHIIEAFLESGEPKHP